MGRAQDKERSKDLTWRCLDSDYARGTGLLRATLQWEEQTKYKHRARTSGVEIIYTPQDPRGRGVS